EHGPIWVDAGAPIAVFRVLPNIEIVHRAPLEGGSPSIAAAPRRNGIALKKVAEFLGDVVPDREPKKLPIEAENETALCGAQPDPALSQHLEHRPQIKRRAANDLEHVGGGSERITGRRFSFQRLRELAFECGIFPFEVDRRFRRLSCRPCLTQCSPTL